MLILIQIDIFDSSCVGDPCPYMEGPSHGNIQCTGPQVTDVICNYKCNPGYSLVGSNNRTCQSNHTWSGEDTECLPMKCSQLTVPDNALILYPCDNEFQSVCTIACNQGYHVTNMTDEYQWKQTCSLGDMNLTVEWTKAQSCSGIYNNAIIIYHTVCLNLTVYELTEPIFST